MGRAVVLLAAGASVPAGLPTAAGLTNEVAQLLAARPQLSAEASAFGWFRSASATRGMTDIESVYADAERHLEYLATAGTAAPIGAPPATLVRRLVGIQPNLRSSGGTEEADPGLIRRAVAVTLDTFASASYLDPLLDLADGAGLDVGTLNYDLTFETAARSRGGATRVWYPAGSVVPGGAVRLWKLHGSLDWTWITESPSHPGAPPRWRVDRPRKGRDRALIFGAGNKLTPYGPFLDLLASWVEALANAEHLLIVGYGFADHHVNETLTRWFWEAPGQRTVTVVTKGGASRTDPPYLRTLRSWLNGNVSKGGPYVPGDGERRLRVLRRGTHIDLGAAVAHVRRLCASPLPRPSDPRPDRFLARVGADTIRNEYDARR